MAAKSRLGTKQQTTKQGPRGKTGPAGPAGKNHTNEIAVLTAQMAQVVKELQTQLTRIAQMQAQLDHLVSGQTAQPRNRRITDQTEH